jgi:hypothetical protein
MRVLVTGGALFRDKSWLWAGLDLLHSMSPITFLIEGGAPGADVIAYEWREARGVDGHTEFAEWERFGKAAGPIRNERMAEMKPDLVLAAPGRKGTANMICTAGRYGLRVILLEKMPVLKTMAEPLAGAPPLVVIDAAATPVPPPPPPVAAAAA